MFYLFAFLGFTLQLFVLMLILSNIGQNVYSDHTDQHVAVNHH